MEAAATELRICMSGLWGARRFEQSYSKKSGLDYMAWAYWWLAEVSSKRLFSG